MNTFLRFVALSLSMLFVASPLFVMRASAEDHVEVFKIKAFDTEISENGVYVYPNDGTSDKVLYTADYGFSAATLFVFDRDGVLFEAGSNLVPNADERLGSPQLSVTIPSGGFLVAAHGDSRLDTLYSTVMQGAMLYNATMTVDYAVSGSFDSGTMTLTVKYDDPPKSDPDAIKILFVGNSETYFNGAPVKFRAMCRAAGINVEVDYCTQGSSYLYQYAREDGIYASKLRSFLGQKKYDYVVLQNGSGSTESDMCEAFELILPLIRDNGAEPVLYLRYSDKYGKSGLYSMTEFDYNVYKNSADKYGVRMIPSGLSFIYCTENFSDVVPYEALYADDHSHHSGYASYMIAATWMYSLFGVSPVGNSFTAHYPDDVVRALQECAVMTCDMNTYDFSSSNQVFREIDGVKYNNIAQGKKYTSTGSRYDVDQWSDTNADNQLLYKLTDGRIAEQGNDSYIGAHEGSDTEIIIDLGGLFEIKQAETDLWGNSSWGIPSPEEAEVTFYASVDGESFVTFGENPGATTHVGEWERGVFSASAENSLRARYIKIRYRLSGKYRWVSEISVFGVKADDSGYESEDSNADTESSGQSVSAGSHENVKDGAKGKFVLFAAGILAALAALSVPFIIKRKKSRN